MKQGQLFYFVAMAAVAGLLCWGVAGQEAFMASTGDALELLVLIVPQIVLGLYIAGIAHVLLPRERVAALLGTESGARGLALATLMGALVPGGPFASFPLILALAKSGADVGAVMAFVVAWSTLGLQRVVIWDVPLLGVDFALLRFIVCLPLPFIAGALARFLAARYAALQPFDAP